MSSSIRPPGAPLPAAAGVGNVGELADGPAGLREGAPAGGVAQAAPAQAAGSPSAEWLRRLDAGEVTRDQAVEGLVAQAVEAHGGARLNAAQRAELSEVLRQSLLGDPVLGALLGA